MASIFPAILLICSLMLSGCSRRHQPPEEEAAENIGKQMVYIESLMVNDTALTLDYEVSNPFGYDIWVCENISIYGKGSGVETRISGGTLLMKRRFSLECNVLFQTWVYAKYRLLPPGESYSGKILLSLPITNASPVYDFDENPAKYKQVILRSAAFEVGYIEGEVINRALEMVKKVRLARGIPISTKIENMPEVREELLDGQSHKFAIVPHIWEGLAKERSAKIVITDVEIPCLIESDG